ncbi:MAG: NAD(P)H-hydrate epimerase, partial [Gammaproteobacteria bacterium]|nr:NAD(P)H-hydrate epimerase [Gammaproteobacteria bacterium]
MDSLPVEIYSVASVRESDRCAIEDHGIKGYTLMVRAGEAAVSAARTRYPDARRWQVVCGAGNNAGDGYVVARLAAAEGIAVSVIALVDPDKLGGNAATAHADFAAEGGVVMPWEGELDADAELLIDGILGSGLERDVAGAFADAVTAMNRHDAPIQALDIPTGLHGDSGKIMGTAIVAEQTLTFVGLKSGLVLGDGPAVCGELIFAGLEIPAACVAPDNCVLRRISKRHLRAGLPR